MSLGDRLRLLLGGGASKTVPASRERVDRVAPWLYLGAALDPTGMAGLPALGVTHVLDLREEGADDPVVLARLGLRWRRIPIPDREPPTDEQLEAILEWLDHEAEPGAEQAVYVHCRAGLTRTPTVAIALLMQQDLTLAEARRLVFAARPEVEPSQRQMLWLESLDARLRAARSDVPGASL